MQGLQVELFGGGDEAHSRPLHGFGDGLGAWLYVFGRHESGVVADGTESATQVMGADTCLHADQAARLASTA